MSKLVLIDGNSIMNRAFYGIMGSKMLMTEDGTYTNAIYGFLAILFKIMEDIKPEYIAVAFDLKAPTARHKMYKGYKATRKGMPEELAQQMPMIKDILRDMKIEIIEKEGYEADDVLGTLSKRAEKEGMEVTILSGDRDTFQLATDKITIRIPRTKMGKTEEDDFDRNKVIESYGLEPEKLIEVKGLMGDTSDNIPGVPGVGEKTALSMIKEYGSIENIYALLEKGEAPTIKGKTREKMLENKELALLSKTLGTINVEVPIEEPWEEFKVEEWDKPKVLEDFEALKFNKYIDRFGLREGSHTEEMIPVKDLIRIIEVDTFSVKGTNTFTYFLQKEEIKDNENRIKKQITGISFIYDNKVYYTSQNIEKNLAILKPIWESETIPKVGYELGEDFVLLKELGIEVKNNICDVKITAYLLNPTESKYKLESLAEEYINISQEEYLNSIESIGNKEAQINMFESVEPKEETIKYETCFKTYAIFKLKDILEGKLKEVEQQKLFNEIEMPLESILANMQYTGMFVDKGELIEFGNSLKEQLESLTKQIYELAGEEFNINSTQQLGVILFEKLNLTTSKKNKKGYSTDVDALEKIKAEHPIVEKILEYRTLMKLNSTYVEGLIPYINEKTNRIHSYFHQTVTATGRLSSSEPNLQNIPTRIEFGKRLRKVFKPAEGYVFIDADYSQIELRILAHISGDKHMLEAFEKGEDIHKQAASKVLKIPIEKVTKEQRSSAKAVNFGIVYGISDFGLAEQLGVSRKEAKKYIEQYLEEYSGIQKFMTDIVEDAKEKGYVDTLFHRRRYIPELKSSNYMVRQFGNRVAMNTPIQGTAADIMKIAMIKVAETLEKEKIDAKIVLQVHDELILEASSKDKERAKQILKYCMESAATLSVPLEVEVSEANNWYEAK